MCDVEAMTKADSSPTSEVTLQTTESHYPVHSPDISEAAENVPKDLAYVISAWRFLPKSMRNGIIAIVQSVSLTLD